MFHDLYNSYESLTCIYPLSLSNDIQFTNCTTRKPLFYDPYNSYESYGSLTCIHPLGLSNDIQFTNCTTRKSLFHDLYNSCESYGSLTCIYPLSLSNYIQFTNCLATASVRQKQHSVGVGRNCYLHANQHRTRVHCVRFHRKPREKPRMQKGVQTVQQFSSEVKFNSSFSTVPPRPSVVFVERTRSLSFDFQIWYHNHSLADNAAARGTDLSW